MLSIAPFLTSLIALASADTGVDPRAAYDVQTYRLDLRVEPETKTLSGTVAIEATVTAERLDTLVLDLAQGFEVARVVAVPVALAGASALEGRALEFRYAPPRLECALGSAAKKGDSLRVAITYSGHPDARDSFTGFHWTKTESGAPWICTSCQDLGSASWWPSKDSFFHPEDKPARVFENYTAPKGLYAVGNGRLAARTTNADATETFHWVHEYPLETYSVTLDVAPYVVVEQELEISGNPAPLLFVYYVLPEHRERAALQFEDVPGMLTAYSAEFGPFPFPKSKFALVETNFWGMEHSTAVAYGSSYPAWLRAHGGQDPHRSENKFFDYILVHESAHEWWGNGVSAHAWGDFWLHEGFATYAESVYLEHVRGFDEAQKHMNTWKSRIGRKSRLYRGDDVDSGAAYDITLYGKGAWVLHTLRTYVDDDDAFGRAVRAFNVEFRYGNATTADFRAVLERETKREWKSFFDEWVYGTGYPKLTGSIHADGARIVIDVANAGTAQDGFHVPLDLAYTVGGETRTQRIWLDPGDNHREIDTGATVSGLSAPRLERILCDAKIKFD